MKRLFVFVAVFICFAGAAFSETESEIEMETGNGPDYSYNLGAEYTYAFDIPSYSSMPFSSMWQQDMKTILNMSVDKPGSKGHLFRVVNQFEWLWSNNFSITAYAKLTLNFIPAYFSTAFEWIPACWNGALNCLDACGKIFNWALSDGWLILNIATAFLIPIAGILVCGTALGACLLAIPGSVLCLAFPMINVGGSVDYHPFKNDFIDTKVSFGLDLDGYRTIIHAGVAGLFVQGEASAVFNNIRLYVQGGYRFDFVNTIVSIKTRQGVAKENYEMYYVPSPYAKVGVAYCFK